MFQPQIFLRKSPGISFSKNQFFNLGTSMMDSVSLSHTRPRNHPPHPTRRENNASASMWVFMAWRNNSGCGTISIRFSPFGNDIPSAFASHFPFAICSISHDSHYARHHEDVDEIDPSGAPVPSKIFVAVNPHVVIPHQGRVHGKSIIVVASHDDGWAC